MKYLLCHSKSQREKCQLFLGGLFGFSTVENNLWFYDGAIDLPISHFCLIFSSSVSVQSNRFVTFP
jgi:hypothetical protein